MQVLPTKIEGLVIIESKVFGDERGFFLETYSRQLFERAGIQQEFVQDNWSRSQKGVLRGLHFQRDPMAQAKLVRVMAGAVWDVAVDLRTGSKTYGDWVGVELSGDNKRSMLVPEGFAHGFCVLSESADFVYKCSNYYAPELDSGIRWDDPELNIAWPVQNPVVSAKDAGLGSFADHRKSVRD